MPSIIPPPGLCCSATRSPLPLSFATALGVQQLSLSKYVPLGTSKCGVATNYPSICRDCKFLLKTVEVNFSYYWKAVSKYVHFYIWV